MKYNLYEKIYVEDDIGHAIDYLRTMLESETDKGLDKYDITVAIEITSKNKALKEE